MGTENWGLAAIGGVASLIASVFYMWGGTKGFGLFWRRFIGSFVLAASTNVIAFLYHTWTWQYLLIYPALSGGMSLGYGADSTAEKILKRSIFALGVCCSGFFGLWASGFTMFGIGVFIMQVVIGAGSVYLGVVNPYKEATLEQYLICQLLTITVPFWGIIR